MLNMVTALLAVELGHLLEHLEAFLVSFLAIEPFWGLWQHVQSDAERNEVRSCGPDHDWCPVFGDVLEIKSEQDDCDAFPAVPNGSNDTLVLFRVVLCEVHVSGGNSPRRGQPIDKHSDVQ